eukprot:m.143171 g.143171  ORF g.143171 m.143171 type:complete len:1204 (+) comp17160_c0_seq1:293-3904(+)
MMDGQPGGTEEGREAVSGTTPDKPNTAPTAPPMDTGLVAEATTTDVPASNPDDPVTGDGDLPNISVVSLGDTSTDAVSPTGGKQVSVHDAGVEASDEASDEPMQGSVPVPVSPAVGRAENGVTTPPQSPGRPQRQGSLSSPGRPRLPSDVVVARSPRHKSVISRTHTMCAATYFGSVVVDAPSSSQEINRHIAGFKASPPAGTREVIVCIPRLTGGRIHVMRADNNELLNSFPVRAIVFCAAGTEETDCIGFTTPFSGKTQGRSPRQSPRASPPASPRASQRGSTKPGGRDAQPQTSSTTASTSVKKPGAEGAGPTEAAKAEQGPEVTKAKQAHTVSKAEHAADADSAAAATAVPAAAQAAPAVPTSSSPSLSAAAAHASSRDRASSTSSNTSASSTSRQPQPQQPSTFYGHIFQFESDIKCQYATQCIAQAFGRLAGGDEAPQPLNFGFNVCVGVSEQDDKGTFAFVPITKDVYKLRLGHKRRISVSIQQTSAQQMMVERAFGLVLAEGRDADESLLTPMSMVSAEPGPENTKSFVVVGDWETPEILLTESPRDSCLAFALGVDIVLGGLQEPIRFIRDLKVRVHKQNDRFWAPGKRDGTPRPFQVDLVAAEDSSGVVKYSVGSITQNEPTQKDTYLSRINKRLFAAVKQDTVSRTESEEDLLASTADEDAAEDELTHVVSGAGTVVKDVSESLLEAWGTALMRWDTYSRSYINRLVRKGIPDALRHQVWQRLVPPHETDLGEAYRFLLNQTSATEQVIVWDLTRTFPAHEYFKEVNGEGQQALYNVNKAYSVYDEEVGYCQGLSFISAVLLLHMPEEEAFPLFVSIMQTYGVRDLFKHGFESLHLKFYQLDQLLEEHMPDLRAHLKEQNVETHMFASQWFLTLFAAKFPLDVVFRIMDMFLAEGLDVLLQISLALLKNAKKDLLASGFEEILGYFRMTLPLSYSEKGGADLLISTAAKFKLNAKKVSKYEEDFYLQKAREAEALDPVQRLEDENTKLAQDNMRLEAETETLATELVKNKIAMQKQIDNMEDENRTLSNEVVHLRALLKQTIQEADDDRERREVETQQVKDLYRKTVEAAEEERIGLVKQVEQLREQLGQLQATSESDKQQLQEQVKLNQAHAALSESDTDLLTLQQAVHEAELSLAHTKLELVESQCRCQSLEQQVSALETRVIEAEKKRAAPLSSWFKAKAQAAGKTSPT